MIGSLQDLLRRAWRHPSGRWGALALLALGLLAAAAPPLLQDPAAMPDVVAGATPPSRAHLLGTDQLNRDMLARVVNGGRISLSVAGLAVLVSLTLGSAVGLVAGYAGGLADAVLMRLVDAALAVPRLFVLLLLLVVWERIPLWALIVVLGTTGWFATSRLVRGEVLRLRHQPFVLAATGLGAGMWRTIARHLLPNAAGPVLVAATLGVGDVILLEAGLSFLGLGIQPPTPSWGGMVLDARPFLVSAPWTALFPGAAIVATVLAVNLLGDALQAALDPRSA
ncbi:MAG TPA: ABC transporter permease [Gemmatimonadales bacterium]|jgi:peptide/nickel transport system permease protein|nr:ABC transporter permease [Gemmatimonadales bacterium]